MKKYLIGSIILLSLASFTQAKKKCSIRCDLIQIRNILANLQINSIRANLCASTSITTATTITAPGNYCFANDITGNITIASNNVSLNLNSFALNGQITVSGSSVNLFGGTINGNNSTDGIIISAGLSDIYIFDLIIDGFLTGINGFSGGGNTNITISDITSRNNSIGASFSRQTNLIVKDSKFIANGFGTGGVGFRIDNSTNTLVDNCLSSNNSIHVGFRDASPSNVNTIFRDCIAEQNNQGFEIKGQNTILLNCQALQVNGTGFYIDQAGSTNLSPTLLNCIATGCAGDGFSIVNTGAGTTPLGFWLENCVSEYNNTGFSQNIVGFAGTLKGCSALSNTLCGFADITGTAATYVNNYSSDNGTNYCFNVADPGAGNAPYFYVTPPTGAAYWDNVAS